MQKLSKHKFLPHVVAIVGKSLSGKTRLIQMLIPALQKRGHSVAVIKHCPKGFTLDTEGKDSWIFMKAGSKRVAMISKDQVVVFQKKTSHMDIADLIQQYFCEADIVLVEGGRKATGLKKIEVLRKGISESMECPQNELLFVVADLDVETDRPVYHQDNVEGIANFLGQNLCHRETLVSLNIEGHPVPVNPFVQKILEGAILGIISSLKGVKDHPQNISLTIKREKSEK